eukprot:sb/3466118/
MVTSGVCFLYGVAGNAVALPYFYRQRMDIPNKLYMLIILVDITTSVLVFPISISYAGQRAPVLFASHALCQVWGVLWNVTSRLSVFLVLTLSVVRCINLTRPFTNIRHRAVMCIVGIYALLTLIAGMFPFFHGDLYEYDAMSVTAIWFMSSVSDTEFLVLFLIFFVVSCSLPVLPILVSAVLSILAIRKSTSLTRLSTRTASLRLTGRRVQRRARNDRASTTIILITMAYLLCNVPFACYLIYEFIALTCNVGISISIDIGIYVRLFLAVFSVSINAALNPCIYYWRIRTFKRYRDHLEASVKSSIVDRTSVVMTSAVRTARKVSFAVIGGGQVALGQVGDDDQTVNKRPIEAV